MMLAHIRIANTVVFKMVVYGGCACRPEKQSATSSIFSSIGCLSGPHSGFDRAKDTATVQNISGNGEETSSLSEEATGGTAFPSP